MNSHAPESTSAQQFFPQRNQFSAKTPLSDRIYEVLLSRVLSSEMEAGSRITIDAVARELELSQTPVRAALQRLAMEGVVVHHHLSGYRVAPKIGQEQFESIIEVRTVLEPVSARNAAEGMPSSDFSDLDALNQQMNSIVNGFDDESSYASFSRIDAEFHDIIARGSGNPYIRESLQRLHTHAHLFRLANYSQITARAVDEHAEVLHALQRRDPGEAALAMLQHVKQSAERFRQGFTEK